MDRWQYLIVLGGCLLVTVPLEALGAGVYRRSYNPDFLFGFALVTAVLLLWERSGALTPKTTTDHHEGVRS